MSNDWSRVCELFERTAASVFNQTIGDFRLVAVCHQRPALKRPFDKRLEFVTADHPVPERDHDAMIVGDKVPKLHIAMQRARELGADYVMPIDADDLVSRRIVEFVLSHRGVDGWFVERGWRYEYGTRWLARVEQFNKVCGSGNIVARRWFSFRGQPDKERQADLSIIDCGHQLTVQTLAARGAFMRPLPFRAAVYIVSSGENSSNAAVYETAVPSKNPVRHFVGRTLLTTRTLLNRRPCTSATRLEFALDPSSLRDSEHRERA
ncbi:MAG: hypothetical protein ABSD21_08150 [Rhizomicrobium sp.]